MSDISATLYAWANAGGIEVRTLERQLVKSGYTPKPRQKIPFKAIDRARLGDKAAAEIRLKEAQAADQERKNRIADGETATLASILKWQDATLAPIRHGMLAMSGAIAHHCNPTDPAHAAAAIDRYINELLSMLRVEIGKVKE